MQTVAFDPNDPLAAIPADLDWDHSVEIAHWINGYEVSPQLGFGEVAVLANGVAQGVAGGGELPDKLEVLWLCLFFEHRRWRHFGTDPKDEDRVYLNLLCQAFARSASR